MSGRSRIVGFGFAAILVVAGLAGAVGFSGSVGQIIALVLIGLGFVLATALVFLEVGLSEDREREQAKQQRAARQVPHHPDATPARRLTRTRPRLDRMRGSRRRLG